MALSTYSEILETVTEQLDELKEQKYPEDYLTELADGYVPIYTESVVSEWFELEVSDRDAWQDFGVMPDKGITDLMAIDLYVYYQGLFSRAYAELTDEDGEN